MKTETRKHTDIRLIDLIAEAEALGCRVDHVKPRHYVFYGEDCPQGVTCNSIAALDEEVANYRL